MGSHKLRVGTRTSKLALWQTHRVIALLRQARPALEAEIVPFITEGDRTIDVPLPQIGGKGLFTAELDSALLENRIDFAVHSLKDLPVQDAPGLALAAVSERADVRDCVISHSGSRLLDMAPGAMIGTSSIRRQSQLLMLRPDLTVRSIRGNVDTRIRKVMDGDYDATILAAAGVKRLGLTEQISEILDIEQMLPAPGQGAMGIQCRADDPETRKALAAVHDPLAAACVSAERHLLAQLGGGCSAPVAAYAEVDAAGAIALYARVATPDGRRVLNGQSHSTEWRHAAEAVAGQLLSAGAKEILAEATRA